MDDLQPQARWFGAFLGELFAPSSHFL